MAVWALAENLNREDLSDYEVSRGVRAIQESYAEPVRVDHLAAALGMSRTQMYRYRAYDALPQPIHDTLAEHPDLLSASHAEAIAGLLKDKTIAEAKLLAAWSEFVSNGFSQKDLITRLRRVDKPVTEAPAEHHLERNGSRVGRMTNNGKTLAITLRSDALSADKQKKLMKFLETLLH